MKLFAFLFLILFPITLFAQAKPKPKPKKTSLDTIYSETYSGFQEGELGDCLNSSEYCEPDLMLMYPLQNNIPTLKKLVYKRIFHDSTRTKISREYVRSEDSIFLYAEYSESGRLMHYGALLTDYQPIVYSVIEDYDSLMNKVPKAVLAVQPIQLRKIGLWQETVQVGAKAGYYLKDEPVGSWKYFSLSFFLDFDLPSQVWTYQKGEIVERDTLNLIEKKHDDAFLQAQLCKDLWVTRWENKNFLLLMPNIYQYPYEAWEFKPDGKLTVRTILNAQSGKAYEGSWQWESPLKVRIDVPNFATTTLNLRYLTNSKMLFYK